MSKSNATAGRYLVIGDSISMGMLPYLAKDIMAARGWEARHAGGTRNCDNANVGAHCLATWLGSERWDAISFNFGLHDCWAPQRVPPADYVNNLEAVHAVASAGLADGGKLVWVQTTPTGNNSYHIEDSCVQQYNTLAQGLFKNKTKEGRRTCGRIAFGS